MSWFGGRHRGPERMDWGSSFAEAEVLKKRRGRLLAGRDAYDVPTMSSQPPGDFRPIGSRRLDAPLPQQPLGSAPLPPRRPGILRRLVSLVLLIAALVLIGGLAYVALSFSNGNDSGIERGTPVKVVIPSGATSDDIAHVLAEKGVIERETVFRARLKLNGDGADFRSGSYTIKAGASYDSIVAKLEKGPAAAPTFDLTVVEGQRLEETAAKIDELRTEAQRVGGKVLPAFTGAEYLKAAKAQRPPATAKAPADARTPTGYAIEGFLFPATYELRHAATAEDFIAKQREAFDANFAELDLARATKAQLTPYDVVIIASLIEREARLAKERPRVAAVIWNRLKGGEPLGIDASNQYSVYETGSKEFWETELKQSQLELDSPYNLRKVGGLPPTPIAAPSKSSLEAAAAPNAADIKNDIRYYVANPDGSGSHFFTASYDEFLNHPFQQG
ncbi:MAG: mltG [Thermoleophilia bacterium]|nr:mltG [Thermoleophilia bacterium]